MFSTILFLLLAGIGASGDSCPVNPDWMSLRAPGLTAINGGSLPIAETAFSDLLHQAERCQAPAGQLATILTDLGNSYQADHKASQAEGAYQRALTLLRNARPVDEAALSTTLNNLGAAKLADG